MAEPIAEHLKRRRSELLDSPERQQFVKRWQEIAEYLCPDAIQLQDIDTSKGVKKQQRIYNPVGTISLRTLKSGMMAGITSPARPWFRLTTANIKLMESAAVKQWLFDVESSMRTIMSRSNFYNSLPSQYLQLAAFGTAALAIVEDFEKIIRCENYSIGTYGVAVSNSMVVDSFCRAFSMTARQLVQEFGIKNVSDAVKVAFESGNKEQRIPITHLIERNKQSDNNKRDSASKPFGSWYWETGKENEKLLRVAGFDEFPLMVPRWDVYSDGVYGFSPGMEALPDVKELQLTAKRKTEAKDKLTRPPMLADANLKTSGASIAPGGITWADSLTVSSSAGMRPIFTVPPQSINILGEEESRLSERIRRIFYEDLMLMFATGDDPTMTAREVEERHQEKLLVLGPVLERLNYELLNPAIDRIFSIMLRRGIVPQPPDEIQGEDLRVEYTSVMAQAQKLIGIANIQQFVSGVGNLASIKGPEVLDKLDADKTVDHMAEMYGIPPEMVHTNDEVLAKREQTAQQQQLQNLAAMAPAMNQGAQAAKNLSETSIDNASALTRLMGGV